MYEFHQDKRQYVEIQLHNAEKYVLPFIEQHFALQPGMDILEIGSGKGSVLKAFANRGCRATGVEMNEEYVQYAREWLAEDETAGRIRFICKDVYQVDFQSELGGLFDLIVMKDVIEHIHDQEKLISYLHRLLKPGGAVFFAFPPWYMPFGGHQQICRRKWLSRLPYYHLLPIAWYRALLRRSREPMMEGLLEIKETGISIERFERICKRCGFSVKASRHYLINPVYEFKFGWKPRRQWTLIRIVPWLRDFLTTGVYYLVEPKN